MGKIIDKFIWFFAGILGSHVGHYIYQVHYAKAFEGTRLSESIAMIFEDLIRLIVFCFDRLLPPLVASKEIIIALVVLVILLIILLVTIRIAARIKNNREYALKIKEAEEIRSQAESEAAQKMEENKLLKKRLLNDFAKKEQALQKTYNEKLAEYKNRIKKLERERLELKETAASLMSRLKKKQT